VQIITWITHQAGKNQSVTRNDILRSCVEDFRESVIHNLADLIGATSSPQEHFRLQIHPAFLAETLRCMDEPASGLVHDLGFNLDKVGVLELEDCQTKRVVGPASLRDQTIHHRVIRILKYVTITPCMASNPKRIGQHTWR
jgi:hypothetical protein